MSRYDWGQRHPGIDRLEEQISDARRAVIDHPMYAALDNADAIRTFQEHHVFAVWDFMSLLKSLQRNLTCVELPWVPTGPTGSRRLINDIVLVEESDERDDGFISHFELYLDGMTQAGADRSVIDAFIDLLRAKQPVLQAISDVNVPAPAAEFVRLTWSFIQNAPVHAQAAALRCLRSPRGPNPRHVPAGRRRQRKRGWARHVRRLPGQAHPGGQRGAHADGDADARRRRCHRGRRRQKWAECADTIKLALAARARLWEGILAAIGDRVTA